MKRSMRSCSASQCPGVPTNWSGAQLICMYVCDFVSCYFEYYRVFLKGLLQAYFFRECDEEGPS